MTTDTPAQIICPNCGNVDGTALNATTRLCFTCRHEWNPAEVQPLTPLFRAVPTATPDDVLGPPDDVLAEREAQARLDALIGTEVILEGGQHATIVSFPDDNHVVVDLGAGDPSGRLLETVDYNDVLRSVETAPVVELPDADALALASTVGTVAALTLRAGISMIEGEGMDAVIGMPPTGWLPDAKGTIAITEQGVAYAVAILLHAYNIPKTSAEAFANDLMAEVTNEQPKGESE